jgi:hypothetical protein
MRINSTGIRENFMGTSKNHQQDAKEFSSEIKFEDQDYRQVELFRFSGLASSLA